MRRVLLSRFTCDKATVPVVCPDEQTAMATQQVALKIAFNGDIHRNRVDLHGFGLKELTQLMEQTFRLTAGDFIVQYRDPEGDCVNVTTDSEFSEAVRVFLSSADTLQTLKFSAVTRRQAEFQEEVADPIVFSIEKLMQALAVTLEQAKRDSQFANSAAPQTAVALDQAARDAAESPKTAAGGFSSFAQGLVGEIKRFIPEKKTDENVAPVAVPEQKPEAVTPVVEPPAAPVGMAAPVAPVGMAAPVAPVGMAAPVAPVGMAAPVAPVAVVAPAQEEEVDEQQTSAFAASVAFSEAEVKWSEQLSIVSGIFPKADVARVIEILEKSDGNLNVVLNVLTEEN
ncbi:hypothetical protein BBJ29_005089 [Phytophthora kernoviae]|uniref:PB1 domain-containing protein n=1 Tax=Phytophthora kernoviae TaxID=325452 RepID=A0A3F2RLQ8_9STRA|nr:hypothetical protein BBP00_00006447 [Phytophthora kernoviae]RLN71454.1 hypothetical protein BBJ29_005089 [Phytophthora kernoviae]